MNAPANAARAGDRWRAPLIATGLTLSLALLLYGSTVIGMMQIWWRSGTFTHGFLIFPIVLFLVWRKREELARTVPVPAPLAMLCLLAAVGLWFVGRLLDVNAAQQFAWVAIIPAVIWLLLGTAVVRVLLFPLAYLFFAVPFGEFMVPGLQDITAVITVSALQWTGIPVLWEGRNFMIPSGSFEVAEACSGVRYLIASIALGTLYAYLTYVSLWRRAIFIVLTLAMPVLANGARAYGVVMIAHLSDHTLAVGVDHLIYGWAFFGVVMLTLFWAGNFFRDTPQAADTPTIPADALAAASPRNLLVWSTVAAVLIAAAPLANRMLQHTPGGEPPEVRAAVGQGGWEGPVASTDRWMPKFHGAGGQQRAVYTRDGKSVQVFVAWYSRQAQGAELINSENRLFDDEDERRLGEQRVAVTSVNGESWDVDEVTVRRAERARVIWRWYRVDGDNVVDPIQAKLLEARARLRRSQALTAVVAIAADYDIEPEQARDVLKQFLDAMAQPLRNSLEPTP